MITPGWIALALIANPRLAAIMTFVVCATYVLSRVLQRYVILYGKRLFATVVLVAVFLQITTFLFLLKQFPDDFELTTLGFIVPGLIAYQLIRQPIVATLLATATVTATAYAVVLVGVNLGLIETGVKGVAAERLDVPNLDASLFEVLLLVTLISIAAALLAYAFRHINRETNRGRGG